jgi:flagellar biosynthesis/type III secretory pathway protein FliH
LGDEELLGRFYILASVRYDRDQLEEMTGGRHMGIIEFLWENSSILTELRQKAVVESKAKGRAKGIAEGRAKGIAEGIAEGKAKGIAEGKAEEAARLLRAMLAKKFPGLESLPELARIKSVKALEDLLIEHVSNGSDRAGIKRAILKTARQANS